MGIYFSKKCEMLPDVKELIKSEKIVVFTVSSSIECFQVLEILKCYSLKPFIINLEQESNLSLTRDALFQLTAQYEVPLIFICSKYFGSLKELKKAVKYKTFDNLLRKNNIAFTDYEVTKSLLLESNFS